MKRKMWIAASVLSIALCACGAGENEGSQTNDANGLGENVSIENTETVTSGQETIDFDMQFALDEAEEQMTVLEKALYEDSSLTQADMNDLSNEMYVVWDDLLNEMWKVLKESLNEETMEALLEEQRAWIAEKEAEVKQAGEEAGGGSLAIMVTNQRAAKITRERVYELAAYFGYTGTIPQNDFSENGTSSSYQSTELGNKITFTVEGIEEDVPATFFEGRDYTLLIPDEGWEMNARECWMSVDNNEVQFWITEYPGEDVAVLCERLTENAGYEVSEADNYFLSRKEEDGMIGNIRLFVGDENVIGIFYCYPEEVEEGFGVRLRAIIDTFEWT